MTSFFCKLIFLSGLVVTTSADASAISAAYQRIHALASDQSDSRTQTKQISTAYDRDFEPLQTGARLHALSTPDLHMLYLAVREAVFYSYSMQYLADMQKDFAEIESRHAETRTEEAQLLESLLQLRQFDMAKSFVSEHPGINTEPLPVVRDERASAQKPSALYIDAEKNLLTLKNVPLDHAVQIIVVGHPLCHFTQNAADAFEGNAALRYILRVHSVWISPQDGQLDIADFRQWNKKHLDMQLASVWKRDQWSDIDDWATPTFYFFKQGRLVDKVVGWPRTGNMPAIQAALRKLGISLGARGE